MRSEKFTLHISHTSILLIILLAAFGLRAWNLTGIPPGLTHDEANHGREAIGILNGIYLYFFPLNYGSEPLYSYTVALFMALLGRGLLALRLVNVVFGTAAVAMTAIWAASRLGRPTALLGAALMAVSFWPLAASREALRAGMLPFFMTLAVCFFWKILEFRYDEARRPNEAGEPGNGEVEARERAAAPQNAGSSFLGRHSSFVIGFGVAVALTLHTYLAARVSWVLFPLFLGYLSLVDRMAFRRAWRPVLAGLLLAGLLVVPMFLYLQAHPEMQTRLDMLDRPLQGIAAGEFAPILRNVRDALLAFVWPGFGDHFIAYNIPGRPVLDIVSAVFFIAGLLVCLRRRRQPVYAFLLLWFLTGIIPSLVTGATANTTRNMASLPAVYLIVAVGALGVASAGMLMSRYADERRSEGAGEPGNLSASRRPLSPLPAVLAFILVIWVAFVSGRDYFARWGESAEVRGAYQHTLVTAIEHVRAGYLDADPILFSTVYPGPAHDSSIALVAGANQPAISETARWADAGLALVLPPERSLAIIPYSTPPHSAFIPHLQAIETVDMRPDDLDPRFTLYWIDGPATAVAMADGGALPEPVDFNGAIELTAARWLRESVQPGETAELLTVWRVLDPARAGPIVPPSFTTDAAMFTHVLDDAGGILTQQDRLDAPSWAWRIGDVIVQVHPMAVPESAAPGDYRAIIGIYDPGSKARLPVAGGADAASAPPLTVAP